MDGTALILFAHGARDPEWAEPMRRVRASICRDLPRLRVELAFLEFMTPGLRECAEALLADGCERIVVLPMFIARGGHLKHDVPRLVDELRRCHPQVSFELMGAIGEAEVILEAMASHARSLVADA